MRGLMDADCLRRDRLVPSQPGLGDHALPCVWRLILCVRLLEFLLSNVVYNLFEEWACLWMNRI